MEAGQLHRNTVLKNPTSSSRADFHAACGSSQFQLNAAMMKFTPLLCTAAWLATALSAFATNWPQYRGPNASGLDSSAALPTRWNIATGENVRWQTPIPGLAHSSPIIWGDRVYVATAVQAGGSSDLKVGLYGNIDSVKEQESNQWRLLALDKSTGSVV